MWTKALRSGKYKKGVGQLKTIKRGNPTVEKFCCLGVLCDLYSKTKVGKGSMWDEELFLGVKDRGVLDILPPKEVVDWAELEDDDPIIAPKAKKKTCSSVNDATCVDRHKGFSYIADLIEKNL